MNASKSTSVPAVQSKRIRSAARFFKWLCLACFGFVIFATLFALMIPSMVMPLGSPDKVVKTTFYMAIRSPIVLENFGPSYKWLYPIFCLSASALLWRYIWFFYKLFNNVESGIFFGRDNVRCIRGIGLWLVIMPILGICFEASKIIWATDVPVNIDPSNLPNDLLKGFFVIFIAWVMDEGRKIQEEQELTV